MFNRTFAVATLIVFLVAAVAFPEPAAAQCELHKLLPQDGAADDGFGISVSISGAIAVVGAPFDDDNATNSGSAYLFDVTTGQQITKLRAQDGAALDYFGYSVAINGDTAIVGAYWDDDNGSYSGSAYLFDIN
ncbi:MAG: FG-GAP repeat protein, partial [Phycisphaerales bacterium]